MSSWFSERETKGFVADTSARYRATAGIFSALLVFAVALTLISPVIPSLAGDFHVSLGRAGILFTFDFVGFCAALALSSLLAGRIRRSRLFIANFLGLGLSLLAFGLAPGLSMACLVILFIGGFGGNVESLGSAVLADLNPNRVGAVLNLSQVFFAAGSIAGPVLAGFALGRGFSWRLVYLGSGLAAVLVFFFLLRIKLPRVPEAVFSWAALEMLATDRWFLGVSLLMLIYVGIEISIWGWLSAYVQSVMSLSAAASGGTVGIFWFSMLLGRAVCSKLSDHVPLPRLILSLSILSIAATVPLCLPTPVWAIWPVIFFIGLGLSGLWPTILAYGGSRYSGHGTMVFNAVVASGGLGGMIAPYIVGVLADAYGFKSGLLFVIGLELLMLPLVLVISRRPRDPDVSMPSSAGHPSK